MSFVHKPGTGSITNWNNGKKHEKAPDYKGAYTLHRDMKAGEVLKLAGWINADDQKTMIKLKPDEFTPDPNYRKKDEGPREYRSKDEIPF